MQRFLSLIVTLTGLGLMGCQATLPAAVTPSSVTLGGGAILPGWAFKLDANLVAGPLDEVMLSAESAELARLRYERGTAETLEWPGSGSGEAVLLNEHGQQVVSVSEGAPARTVLIPAGVYRLEVRNLASGGLVLTRGQAASTSRLRLERVGAVEAQPERDAMFGVTNFNFSKPDSYHSGAHAAGLNLQGRVFSRLVLERSNILGCNFDRVKTLDFPAGFSHSTFHGVTFIGATLPKANFRSSTFDHVTLMGATMPEADFNFIEGNRADFSRVNMPRASFRQASLAYANLSQANFEGATFRGADATYANFRGANLSGADLSGADFRNADMSAVRLDGATFGYTIWTDGTLRSALP